MAVTGDHIFGWEKEAELQIDLEKYLNMKLIKTEQRYDHRDFYAENNTKILAELKSRKGFDKLGRPQMPSSFSTWLIPSAKFLTLLKENQFHIFYYWDYDKSLWYLKYDKEIFKTFKEAIPPHHTQPHFFIPSSAFRKIQGAKSKCLIVDNE